MFSRTRSPQVLTSSLAMRLLGCLALLLVLLPAARPAAAAPGDVRSPLWITDGTVSASVASDDTLYIGGTFKYVGPMTGNAAGVDATTGALVTGFPLVNGQVNAVVADGAGGWYIGGVFTSIAGVTRNRLAHIKADKTLDAAWNPNPNGSVNTLLITTNGQMLVGGDFTTIGGQSHNRLALFNADGTLNAAWTAGTNGSVRAITVVGSTLYVGGTFITAGTPAQTRNKLAAFDLGTGALNTTWDPNVATGNVYALATNGTTVYVGGDFTTNTTKPNSIGGQPRNRFAEVDTATGAATALNPNPSSTVNALAFDGTKLYLGGSFTQFGLNTPYTKRNRLAAITVSDGAINNQWDPNANNTVYTLKVVGSTIYVGGDFTTFGTGTSLQTRNRVAALDAASGTPTAWTSNTHASVRALDTAGGVVFAGGLFVSIGGVTRTNLAALNTQSGAATAWDPAPNSPVYALLINKIGNASKLYVGGAFTYFGTAAQTRRNLALFDISVNPPALNAFNFNLAGNVRALAVNSTTLYAGGDFTKVGTTTRNRLAAFNLNDNALNATWNPSATSTVNALAANNSTVYVGGNFKIPTTPAATVGGQQRNYLAALDATTGLATTWNPNPNGIVSAFALSGTTLYVGGAFTGFGAPIVTRNRLASFDTASDAPSAWNPNANSTVSTLAVSDFNVYAGGGFTTVATKSHIRLAEIDKITGVPSAWNPTAPGGTVATLAIGGSLLYAGGAFTTIGTSLQTQPRRSIMGVEVLTSMAITSGRPPAGSLDMDYSFTFTSNGNPPPTWSASTLPPGLSLDPATGKLTGRPLQIGNYTFVVTANNGTSTTATQEVTLMVGTYGSTTTLTSSGATTYGQAVTLIAQVASTGTAVGTVTFQSDGSDIASCVALPLSTNKASCTTTTIGGGEHIITAMYNGNLDVASSTSNEVAQTVTPAPLTITANNVARKIGQPLPEFTVRHTNMVNGEDISALEGTLTITSTVADASQLGEYPIVASGLTSDNYVITYVNGKLKVTNKDVPEITWPVQVTTYGAPLGDGQLNATASFNGQPVAGTFTYTPAAGTLLPLGPEQALAAIFTPADTTEFETVDANTTITVNKAPLTVKANDVAKLIGTPNPDLSVSYIGFVNNEDTSVLVGTLSLTTTATTDSPAGKYPIVPSGLTSANYDIAFVNGTFSVEYRTFLPTVTQ